MGDLYTTVKQFLQEYSGAIDLAEDDERRVLDITVPDLLRLQRAFRDEPVPGQPWEGSTLREAAARLSRAIHPLVDGTKVSLNLHELNAAHEALGDVLRADREHTEPPKRSEEDLEIVKLVAGLTVVRELLLKTQSIPPFGGPSGPDVIELIKEMQEVLFDQYGTMNGERAKRAKAAEALIEKLGSVSDEIRSEVYQVANAGPPSKTAIGPFRKAELRERGRVAEAHLAEVPLEPNVRDFVDTLTYVLGGPGETVAEVRDTIWEGVVTSRKARESK